MDGTGTALEPVEQRLPGHPVIRIRVVGWNAALVAPPELDVAPVRRLHSGELIRLLRRPAAREHDVAARDGRAREPLCGDSRDLVRVVDDDELDVAASHSSPAASSFDRSMAA